MNNFRAGLYSFAPTTTWLRKMGTASPPYLVMFGLILPDSRMLSGIASIGLTLANIAFILPYLRQPLLESLDACEGRLVREQRTQEQKESPPDKCDSVHPVLIEVDTPTLAFASPHDEEAQNALPTVVAAIKPVRFPVTEPMECSNVDSPLAVQPLSPRATDNDQTDPPSGINAAEHYTSFNSLSLLTRQGRSALHVPLPVPDAAEIALFDSADTLTFNYDLDLEGEYAKQDVILEESSSVEDDELIATDSCLSPPRRLLGQGFADMEMLVSDEYVAYIEAKFPLQNIAGEPSVIGEKDDEKKRPECLAFIPQSVISRYPSALVVSTERRLGHHAFTSSHGNQITPQKPTSLLDGASPQAGSERHWRGAFFTECRPDRRLTGMQTLVFDTIPAQDPSVEDQGSLPESPMLGGRTPSRRRLGVLGRAALRNRRLSARRWRDNENDDSSDSDSDSDSSDSEYSSGSSADNEDMLPVMLGADLLAALDANSESGLNLASHRRPSRAPTLYDGSMADISMVMQVSSLDDGPEGEAKAVALTYEDIEQWASGVVQKCVRQVCRARAPADPLQSPSQASDVCAEKPSGLGPSQCPFSGLHCRMGAGHGSAGMANEVTLLPQTLILPPRKICDIPEFVPRQVTREAASKVIARLESQVGFTSRRRPLAR